MRAESFKTRDTIFLNLCGPFIFISIIRSRYAGYKLNAPDIKIQEYYFSFLPFCKQLNFLSQKLQVYNFLCLCIFSWTFLLQSRVNNVSQNLHLNGFSPKWVFSWTNLLPFLVNGLSQNLQQYSFYLKWVFSCIFLLKDWLNFAPQILHV